MAKRKRSFRPRFSKKRRFRRRVVAKRRPRKAARYITRKPMTVVMRTNMRFGGLAQRIVMKHSYQNHIVLGSSSIGALQEQSFRLNGMHDPVVATGGAQPNFYDDMAAFYKRYRVTACKVDICIVPMTLGGTPSLANPGARLLIHAGRSDVQYSLFTDLTNARLTPGTKEMCFGPGEFGHSGAGYGGTGRVRKFSAYYKIYNFFRDEPYLDNGFSADSGGGGSTSADPTHEARLFIQTQQLDAAAHGTGANSDYRFSISTTLTYYATWSERLPLNFQLDT